MPRPNCANFPKAYESGSFAVRNSTNRVLKLHSKLRNSSGSDSPSTKISQISPTSLRRQAVLSLPNSTGPSNEKSKRWDLLSSPKWLLQRIGPVVIRTVIRVLMEAALEASGWL